VSPAQHLDAAKQVLDEMPSTARRADLRRELAGLRKAFGEMMSAYASSGSALGGTKDHPASIDWQSKFFDVERQLADLIGGSSTLVFQPIGSAPTPASQASGQAPPPSPPSPTGTAAAVGIVTPATASVGATASSGATDSSIPPAPAQNAIVSPNGDLKSPDGSAPPRPIGTSGTSVSPTLAGGSATSDPSLFNGLKDLDPALREALERFRLHVELFFDSTTVDQH
jgi:hypothetical protein